jgi:hypothetical protein
MQDNMAVPEEVVDGQQEGEKETHDLVNDGQVTSYIYSAASTQISLLKALRNSLLPQIPKLSSDLNVAPDSLVTLKFWDRVHKDIQKNKEPTRVSIIDFFDNISTDNKMAATTKTDAKEKLDGTLQGRVQLILLSQYRVFLRLRSMLTSPYSSGQVGRHGEDFAGSQRHQEYD